MTWRIGVLQFPKLSSVTSICQDELFFSTKQKKKNNKWIRCQQNFVGHNSPANFWALKCLKPLQWGPAQNNICWTHLFEVLSCKPEGKEFDSRRTFPTNQLCSGIWDNRRLSSMCVSTACYMDSFMYYVYMEMWSVSMSDNLERARNHKNWPLHFSFLGLVRTRFHGMTDRGKRGRPRKRVFALEVCVPLTHCDCREGFPIAYSCLRASSTLSPG
jgi:hypothetical protein